MVNSMLPYPNPAVFDDTACELGEGPLWHPLRQAFFWFDILNSTLMMRSLNDTKPVSWQFTEMVSAAGWIDEEHLLIASETRLFKFNISTENQETILPLEADNSTTRSNDGRADPWGGFWIGTMGKNADSGAGAIYRYYDGELRTLVSNITISNAICFSPDRSVAYYTDTPTRKVMRIPLDIETGWPNAEADVFLDLNKAKLNPDGAVVDKEGNLWMACWGDSSIRVFNHAGSQIRLIKFDARQVTCPAFGGSQLSELFVTSAAIDERSKDGATYHPGCTFITSTGTAGVPEPAVILSTEHAY